MTKRRISLKIALVVPFVLLLVFAVGMVGTLSYYYGRGAVRELARELRNDISLRIHEHLNTFLSTPHLINRINEEAMSDGMLDPTNQQELERHFWKQIRSFDTVTSIYFGNPAGGHVNSGREGAGGTQYVIATDGFVRGSFDKYATDENGNKTDLIVRVPNFDSSKRQWYIGAAEKEAPYWTPVYILFTGQDMAIAASRPVYDNNGRLLGVVGIDIFLSHLSHFLRNIKIGKTGEAFIVERSGLLVATSTEEDLFHKIEGGETVRINAADSEAPLIRNAALAVRNQLGGFENINENKLLEYSVNDKKRFLQVSPVEDENGLDWLVAVVIPESDFLGQIRENNKTTLILMALALLCAVSLGVVTAGLINRPIEQLSRSARAMKKGKWEKPALTDSYLEEVNQLLHSFNDMAEELEIEKEFTRAVLDTIPDTVYVFDPETGEPLIWNRALEEVSGYSTADIVSRRALSEWFSENDKAKVDSFLNASPGFGKRVLELDLVTKDGRTISTEYNASEFTSVRDNRRLIVSVGRDIRERKKSEEALKENAERFHQMFSKHSAVMLLIDPDTRIIMEPNEAAVEFYGYSREELCGMHVSVINQLPPDEMLEEIRMATSSKKTKFEVPHRLANGDVRIVSVLTSPIFVNGRKLQFSIVSDITEQKKAEALLKARMRLLEYATGHTLDELLVETLDQVEALTGSSIGFYHFVDSEQMNLTLQAWSTRTVREFCKAEAKGMSYSVGDAGVWCDCIRERKAVIHNDYKSMKDIKGLPDGHAEVVRELVAPIMRNGRIVAILGVGNKATDYNNEDLEVVTHMADVAWEIVAHKLMEDDREKLGSQLLQSQKMEAIGVLAGGVAHDFNNLLGIIMGSAQLAMYDLEPTSDPYNELTAVVDAAGRAKDLIMKLLTFARKERVSKSVFSIHSIVSSVTGILQRSVLKNITIKVNVDENVKVLCDENQLYQAILNICNNAADAMKNGGEITIECKEVTFEHKLCETCGTDMDGAYCLLEISDRGEGIAPDILPKVFEPFFTTKDIGQGSGLGLSVTHGIIKSHNGHMHIESELRKGAKVKIFLPLSEEATDSSPEKNEARKAAGGDETVLIVDDEQGMLEMAGRLLKKKGYTPIMAINPFQGIEMFRQRKDEIALVILDLLMPEMDGAEVFRIMKEIDRDVKVLFSSGYGINDQAFDMMRDNEYRYIQKPYDVEELCLAVRDMIDNG